MIEDVARSDWPQSSRGRRDPGLQHVQRLWAHLAAV